MTHSPTDHHIFILEDEPILRSDLEEYLHLMGYSVTATASLEEYYQAAAGESPDLILLDINLPDGNGFDFARKLRATSKIGIVMLTNLGSLDDRLVGLDCGADAFLVKHADLREIEATIRAVLRRIAERSSEPVWCYSGIEWQLTAPNGKSVKLTATEAAFMSIILETPGLQRTREDITAILPRPKDSSDRGLDSMVKRLRKKITLATDTPFPVNVVYGVGYCFNGKAKLSR